MSWSAEPAGSPSQPKNGSVCGDVLVVVRRMWGRRHEPPVGKSVGRCWVLLRAATQQRPIILFELGSMCRVCSMLLTRTYSGELKC
jgi:hypothetical protein